jgi:hypothetical protein
MKNATLSLIASTAVFAATSIYLAVELGKARDELAAATAARPAITARVVQPTADAFRQVAAAQPPAPKSPAKSAPLPAAARLEAVPSMGRSDARFGDEPRSDAADHQRRLMQETRVRQRYADMPHELGLDKAQADKLFDLLTDSQLASFNDRRSYRDDPAGSRAIADAESAQRDAAIEALLGPDKAAEFQSFEKSIPARMQVGRIDAQMTAADIPLREDQRTAMIAMIAAEQAARPPPDRDPAGNDPDYRSRMLDWQAGYSARVQQQVEPLLTPAQQARFREAVEVQNARRAAERARADAQRSAQQQP